MSMLLLIAGIIAIFAGSPILGGLLIVASAIFSLNGE